jgi:hypothetical protein
MAYPPLVHYSTEAEYRSHYERVYCRGPIATFDGIKVRFRKDQFDHCFFESTKRDGSKDQFSSLRAPRIDWIKTTLEDPAAELHCGWDKKRKCYDSSHRVAVVVGNYVVVIRLTGSGTAAFVTAYLADSSSTIAKIRQAPQWTPGA